VANGDGGVGAGISAATGKIVDAVLSGRVTKWAGIPIVLAGLVKVVYWLPFVHFVPGEVDQMSSGLFYIAVGIAIIGIAGKQKSTSDLLVHSEAEKRIVDPSLPQQSSVPAIQREITRLLDAGAVSPPPTIGPRKTGDVNFTTNGKP